MPYVWNQNLKSKKESLLPFKTMQEARACAYRQAARMKPIRNPDDTANMIPIYMTKSGDEVVNWVFRLNREKIMLTTNNQEKAFYLKPNGTLVLVPNDVPYLALY